jgi:hypothetical protein
MMFTWIMNSNILMLATLPVASSTTDILPYFPGSWYPEKTLRAALTLFNIYLSVSYIVDSILIVRYIIAACASLLECAVQR